MARSSTRQLRFVKGGAAGSSQRPPGAVRGSQGEQGSSQRRAKDQPGNSQGVLKAARSSKGQPGQEQPRAAARGSRKRAGTSTSSKEQP